MADFLVLIPFLIMVVVLNTISKAVKAEKKENKRNLEAQYKEKMAGVAQRFEAGAKAAYKAFGQESEQKNAAGTRRTNSTTQAVREKARQKANTTIVERAKANTAKLEGDETLRQIEESHGHSETHVKAPEEHSRNCRTLDQDPNAVETAESIFGSTEDLIVKGYSGSIQFERDFIAEGMDMLAAISVPDKTA